MPGRVRVGRVWLPADDVAQALHTYAVQRLMEERRTRSGGRAFGALPWFTAAEDLRGRVQQPPPDVTPSGWLTTIEAARAVGRDPATIRRWAARGGIPGAWRGPGGCWCIPTDFVPPADGRRRSTK